jgi:hypothetical protein
VVVSSIVAVRRVGKRTLADEQRTDSGTESFHSPATTKGREAMYLGIGGLILLIIILYILFR